jgi:hypothetical protein
MNRKEINRLPLVSTITAVFLILLALMIDRAQAQYLGVTCGYQYSSQLTGPLTYPNQLNISMFNPMGGSPYDPNCPTWATWVEQLQQAGVDFVCPNCTGSWPNTNNPPSQMAPMVAAVNARGLQNTLKFACFDDNAASWCAQYNQSIGKGYGYATPMDLSNTNNWKFIYDYNYKIFFQTVPDANRFKINCRPVIIIWSSGPLFITNAQGNLSRAFTYVRNSCQRDFGFNPIIIDDAATTQHDTTCTNTGILDGMQGWFIAGPSGPSHTLTTFNGTSVGVACAEFQHPGQSGFLDPNHGALFKTGLSATVGAGALITLCEGFTDYEEDAAMFRVRNINASGVALPYSSNLYDYPNQRIGILRQYSRNPFPSTLLFEAEACDWFGGAAGGNGLTNYYRNGNIAIQTTTDANGGYNVGWIQSGEWLEWTNVPLNGTPTFVLRVATPNSGCTAHLVIDGVAKASVTLPNTGGWQTYANVSFGPYGSYTQTYHDIRIVFDNGGENFNWWETSTSVTAPTFTSGTFTSDSVLTMAGTTAQEVYGVSLGNSSAETTANGYTFAAYPSSHITYGGTGAYSVSGFLGGGGSSGDTPLNTVLGDAELGINNGILTLTGLSSGTTYKVLFLEADTRSGMGTRTFQITTGSVSSSNQSYAFAGGSPSLGGYILCTFTATGTTQTFTNTAAGYGYQLNAILVGHQ